MIYRVIIFILLCIGFAALVKTQKDDTLVLKKQSIAQNKRNAMLSKRRRFVDKKPNVFERFKTISEEMLKSSRSNMTFSKYIRVSLLFSLGGVIVGLLLNNILLSIVLAVGMLFVPLEYLVVRQSSYTQMINEQMETALSLITNSYLQSGDIIKAVKENLHRIEPPFYNLFAEFIAEKTFVDSNISRNIRKLKTKVDNSFFSEWCDTLILCQQDRELMYVLPTIVEKMSDIKQIQEELNTQMYNIYKDHISVTLVVAANIPLMRF
ncbi:MAG: hypothetical protein IJZ16_03085, partial [Clostridia bacterium]|nr:hypothetical protein [Clostridia bacterium]